MDFKENVKKIRKVMRSGKKCNDRRLLLLQLRGRKGWDTDTIVDFLKYRHLRGPLEPSRREVKKWKMQTSLASGISCGVAPFFTCSLCLYVSEAMLRAQVPSLSRKLSGCLRDKNEYNIDKQRYQIYHKL